MNSKELKIFILEEASKYLDTPKSVKQTSEKEVIKEDAVTASDVKLLAEEMRKINKRIDLRDPLINPALFDKVKEIEPPIVVIKESKDDKILKENDQKKRWKNLYNYSVFKD